jgi:hypothetical protein
MVCTPRRNSDRPLSFADLVVEPLRERLMTLDDN